MTKPNVRPAQGPLHETTAPGPQTANGTYEEPHVNARTPNQNAANAPRRLSPCHYQYHDNKARNQTPTSENYQMDPEDPRRGPSPWPLRPRRPGTHLRPQIPYESTCHLSGRTYLLEAAGIYYTGDRNKPNASRRKGPTNSDANPIPWSATFYKKK